MTILIDDCCGIIRLKNGCFIIGYMNLLCAIYLISNCIFGIIRGDIMTHLNSSFSTAWAIGTTLITIYSIILVPVILELIFTILLLVGLHQDRRGFVKAYLIFKIVFLVIYIFTFTAYLGSGNLTFKVLITSSCVLCFSLYYFLVIRSYYIKMGSQTKSDDTECETS